MNWHHKSDHVMRARKKTNLKHSEISYRDYNPIRGGREGEKDPN